MNLLKRIARSILFNRTPKRTRAQTTAELLKAVSVSRRNEKILQRMVRG